MGFKTLKKLKSKKQFTPLILFKAQTDGLKIDEHRTSNVQHRMMNGKNEEANV